jgi:hypothetical protein
MHHLRLPDTFTLIGTDDEGKEYVQCTRTGNVLVQTGPDEWTHFATAREWRSKTAARLYPELIFLQRALKRVGMHEEIEDQIRVLREAQALLTGLDGNIRQRIEGLERERMGAGARGRRVPTA